MREARFDAAYTFAYSRRTLTKAAAMPGQLSRTEKSERLSSLNTLVLQYVKESSARYFGKTVEVLAESKSRMNGGELSGRTRTSKMVSFLGCENEIGEYIDIDIDRVSNHTLHGLRKD